MHPIGILHFTVPLYWLKRGGLKLRLLVGIEQFFVSQDGQGNFFIRFVAVLSRSGPLCADKIS